VTLYSGANEPWAIKKGDYGKPLLAQLRDSDGPVDLTGCTVRFFMRKVGAVTSVITDALCTTVSALTGEVRYAWTAPDLAIPGDYFAEFEVTLPLGDELTFPTHKSVEKRYIKILIEPTLD
jgi:hypothetical protein